VKIGAKVVRYGRYVIFQMAEVAVPRELFEQILRLIDGLQRRPAAAWRPATARYVILTGGVCPIDEEKGQIGGSHVVRDDANARSMAKAAYDYCETQPYAIVHADPEPIWIMSVDIRWSRAWEWNRNAGKCLTYRVDRRSSIASRIELHFKFRVSDEASMEEIMSDQQKLQMDKNIEIAYKDAVDNIIATKRQQVLAVIYASVGYGAIYGVSLNKNNVPLSFLLTASVILMFVILYYLVVLQRFHSNMRRRISNIYRLYFSKDEKKDLELSPLNPVYIRWYDLIFVTVTLTVGGCVALILLLKNYR
jgi:hypothetical protein